MNLKNYITQNENIQERLKVLVKSDDLLAKEIFFFLSRINENELLKNCTQQSLVNTLLTVLSVGASFDKIQDDLYLIPIKRECTVQFTYKFHIKLLQRAGMYDGFKCAVVYEKDEFKSIDLETGQVEHKVKTLDRGKIIGAYCIIKFEKTIRVEVMTNEQINIVMEKADKFDKTGKKYYESKTWREFKDQMILKSILYRTLKYVPLVEKTKQLAEALKAHEENFSFDEPKKRKEIAFFTPEIEEKSEVADVEQIEIQELEENLIEEIENKTKNQ